MDGQASLHLTFRGIREGMEPAEASLFECPERRHRFDLLGFYFLFLEQPGIVHSRGECQGLPFAAVLATELSEPGSLPD